MLFKKAATKEKTATEAQAIPRVRKGASAQGSLATAKAVAITGAAAKGTATKDAAKDAQQKPKEKKELRIVRYFKEVRAEITKVTWPTRKNATNLTLIVLGFTAAMSVILGLIDWMFSRLFGLLIR